MEMTRKPREDKTVIPPKAFYLSESFFEMQDSTQSMDSLAPEILKAKSATELEPICERLNINAAVFGKDNTLLSKVAWMNECDPSFHRGMISMFSRWMFYSAQTISVCYDLYRVCLRIVRQESDASVVSNIMDMLHFAEQASRQRHKELEEKENLLKEVYHKTSLLDFGAREIPRFPLLSFYRYFQCKYGEKLQQEYGHDYHRTRKKEHYQHRYWYNPDSICDLRTALRVTAKSDTEEQFEFDGQTWYRSKYDDGEDKTYILELNDRGLAEKILSLLDRYVDYRISDGIRLQIDSASGKTKAVSKYIDTALFLWIYTQVEDTKNCRICKLCGRVYTLGTQKTRQYCSLHDATEMDYFYKKARKKKEKSDKRKTDINFIIV